MSASSARGRPAEAAGIPTPDRVNGFAADHPFVVESELSVPVDGADDLEAAFADRLRLVEGWAGFGRLEVWADERDPTRYLMISWWRSRDDFVAYMRSADHDASHERVPSGPLGPRPRALRRYRLVAT